MVDFAEIPRVIPAVSIFEFGRAPRLARWIIKAVTNGDAQRRGPRFCDRLSRLSIEAARARIPARNANRSDGRRENSDCTMSRQPSQINALSRVP
ncbi:MAG TPA: hypothetical protein VF658_00875 [Pyrinomonadaceae bacterium]